MILVLGGLRTPVLLSKGLVGMAAVGSDWSSLLPYQLLTMWHSQPHRQSHYLPQALPSMTDQPSLTDRNPLRWKSNPPSCELLLWWALSQHRESNCFISLKHIAGTIYVPRKIWKQDILEIGNYTLRSKHKNNYLLTDIKISDLSIEIGCRVLA